MQRQRGAQVIADKGAPRSSLFPVVVVDSREVVDVDLFVFAGASACLVPPLLGRASSSVSLFRWRWCPQQGTLDLGRWLVAR